MCSELLILGSAMNLVIYGLIYNKVGKDINAHSTFHPPASIFMLLN